MSTSHIRQSMEGVIEYLTAHPAEARGTDKAAVAVVEEGLRCRAEGPDGAVAMTDMPKAVGGDGAWPTPGWLMRAALATCDATMITMRAAQLGVDLDMLEVTVDSESDDRGLLGMDDAVPPGPFGMRVRIRIGANGVASGRLREIVEWAERHSPVGEAVRRAVSTKMDIEVA